MGLSPLFTHPSSLFKMRTYILVPTVLSALFLSQISGLAINAPGALDPRDVRESHSPTLSPETAVHKRQDSDSPDWSGVVSSAGDSDAGAASSTANSGCSFSDGQVTACVSTGSAASSTGDDSDSSDSTGSDTDSSSDDDSSSDGDYDSTGDDSDSSDNDDDSSDDTYITPDSEDNSSSDQTNCGYLPSCFGEIDDC